MPGNPRRILVVGPAWVGDMIMSQVIYASLRDTYPEAVIDVLAPPATLPLVARMPEVSMGIVLAQTHGDLGLGYRFRLGRRLAANHYDHAIVTPNSLKSALVPFFAGIPKRTGFLGEYRYYLLNDMKMLDKKQLPLMTDRFLALVERDANHLVKPKLMVDADNQQAFIEKHGLDTGGVIVGFCPGAEFGDSKKWPEAHYVELGRQLTAAGYQVWIFGSPGDLDTGQRIERQVGEGCRNLAGKTSLKDVVDLLACCDRVVTNDSGLMHVAAAVGTRVVAVYGSTSPAFTPPLADDAVIVRLGLDCSPCFKRVCPLGHKNCLNQLYPDSVLTRLDLPL